MGEAEEFTLGLLLFPASHQQSPFKEKNEAVTGDGCTSIYSSTVLLVRDTKRCDPHQWSCLGNYPMCRYGYTSNFIFLKTQRTCCAACLCPYSGVFFPVHFESTKQGCVQMRKHLVSVTASVVLFWAGIPCVAKALEFWNT